MIPLKPGQELNAAHPGHIYIEENYVGRNVSAGKHLKCILTIICRNALKVRIDLLDDIQKYHQVIIIIVTIKNHPCAHSFRNKKFNQQGVWFRIHFTKNESACIARTAGRVKIHDERSLGVGENAGNRGELPV